MNAKSVQDSVAQWQAGDAYPVLRVPCCVHSCDAAGEAYPRRADYFTFEISDLKTIVRGWYKNNNNNDNLSFDLGERTGSGWETADDSSDSFTKSRAKTVQSQGP